MSGQQIVSVVIGQFPPPISGASKITEAVALRCAELNDVARFDLKMEHGAQPWRYAWGRLVACCRATVGVMRLRAKVLVAAHFLVDDGFGVVFALPCILVARARGWPVFVHHHSFRYVIATKGTTALLRLAGGVNARHVFLCEAQREAFIERYGSVCSWVLGNGWSIEVPAVPAAIEKSDRRLHIGLLSNLTLEKGVGDFLALLRACSEQNLPVVGHLGGPLVGEEVERLVNEAKLNLGDRLRVHGPLYGDAKWAFFRDLDCFVLPTRHASEAQPLVVLEAMASGCAVIAFERGCIGDDLGAGGLAVPTGVDFVAAAREQLARWIARPAELAETRKAAMERFAALRARSEAALGAMMSLS